MSRASVGQRTRATKTTRRTPTARYGRAGEPGGAASAELSAETLQELIERIGADARIYLYHIPPIAIVGFSIELVTRLREAFSEQIVGIKDSSGDWNNTRALLGIDGLVVYPGSEEPLIDALELGAPGCISATANTNAAAIAKVIRHFLDGDVDRAKALHADVVRFRLAILEQYAPIPTQKRLIAMRTGEMRWATVRPPLTAMGEDAGKSLAATL